MRQPCCGAHARGRLFLAVTGVGAAIVTLVAIMAFSLATTTTTRSPTLMAVASTFCLPRANVVFWLSVTVTTLPSGVFISNVFAVTAETVPSTLCAWPSCARAATGMTSSAARIAPKIHLYAI